jgi:hypothetical protein
MAQENEHIRKLIAARATRAKGACCPAGIENDELLPEPLRRGLYVSSLRLSVNAARIHEHGN